MKFNSIFAKIRFNTGKWIFLMFFMFTGCSSNSEYGFKIFILDSNQNTILKTQENSYLHNNDKNNNDDYLLVLDTNRVIANMLLEFDNSHTDKLYVFSIQNGNQQLLSETGDLVAFKNRKIKHRNILIPIDNQDSIVVKVVNRGAYIIPVSFYENLDFLHFDFIRNSWLGACLGIILMFLMVAVGAVIFSRGNKMIWYYLLFGLFSFLFFLTEFGYGDVYFWSENPRLEEPMIFAFILGSVISLLLLVFKVFHLEEGKNYWLRIQKGLLLTAFIFLITLLTGITHNDGIFAWYYNGLLLLVVFVFLFAIIAGIKAIKSNVQYSAYFLFAMSILIIGSLLKPLSLAGLVGFNGFVQYGGVVGLMVSLVAFAGLFLVRYFDGLNKSIKLENQIIYLERSALQAQMNPHFIFNSLNSIQNYIAKNDQLKAMDYLSGFAKLVRRILNASSEKIISIDEEISMLEGYLKLEKLRFKDKFDYKLSIPENLDIHNIGIPPLLIQPFVENAVIHGMKNLTEQGYILVKFIHQPPFLKVIIEDNGVGIDRNNKSGHKSKGMSITQKRLAHLNKSKEELSIRIDNKKDLGINESGTIVTLMIITQQNNKT